MLARVVALLAWSRLFSVAEGVGDALVGGISLPVDAMRVDLEQNGDAVPGAAGDLGRGHPGEGLADLGLVCTSIL